MLLSGTIQPETLTWEEISFKLRRNRFRFKMLFMEFKNSGNFLDEYNDIIVKDIRRLDPKFFDKVRYDAVYPLLTKERYLKIIEVIIRMYERFELS